MSIKIHGNRVYLDLPELPDNKVTISPELKKQLQEERMKQMDKLKVYSVGATVEDFKTGDEVFVDPSALQRGIFIKIGENTKIIVSKFDIAHTWDDKL